MRFAWLLSIGIAVPAGAAPRVVLLSTVERSPDLAQIFRARFGDSGYELVQLARARAPEIWREAQDPRNVALFFVGHAANSRTATGGQSEATITDADDNNVADILLHPHADMKFVGLVACYGQKIVDQYRSQGALPASTRFFSFHSVIDPLDRWLELSFTHGLTRAIDDSVAVLAAPTSYGALYPYSDPCSPHDESVPGGNASGDRQSACRARLLARRKIRMPTDGVLASEDSPPAIESARTLLRRTTLADAPGLKVSQDGRALMVLPPLQAGDTQEARIPFSRPEHPLLIQSLKDERFSRATLHGQTITITEIGAAGAWEPLRGRSGRVLGEASRVFRLNAGTARY